MIKRKEIVFHGRVQGVGFRWTAIQHARDLGLTGWVRNEYDGTVTMEVQGEDERIDALVEGLYADRWIRIDNIDVRSKKIVPGEKDFSVKY